MAQLRIERVNSLPATLEPSTLYYVKSSDAGLVDLYVTGNDASEVRHLITKAEIQSLIASAVSGMAGAIVVVQDIEERDALTLTASTMVLVLDATSDETVQTGSALYVWDDSTGTWYKVAEYESLDLSLDWGSIQGGPASSPSAIDDAVAKSHTHSNKPILDGLGVDEEGSLTYNSAVIANVKAAPSDW